MDPAKIKAVLDMPTPDKVLPSSSRPRSLRKLVRIFLGMTGFYRSLIKNYAVLAKPLHELTSLNTPAVWKSIAAWERLKQAMTKNPVLIRPRMDKGFVLETD